MKYYRRSNSFISKKYKYSRPTFQRVRKSRTQQPASAAVNSRSGAPKHSHETFISVGDPDPEPDPDPHVFGPPGSGYFSQRYGSRPGSGSFPFLINVLIGTGSGTGSVSISQRYGSGDTDPDPLQNVTDPQHDIKPGVRK
jgi:hypothetical protein